MIAWVLNLEAEHELRSRGYSPSRAVRARSEAMSALIAGLVAQDDVVLPRKGGRAAGLSGRAWCPTPSALEQLRAAGAVVPPAPAYEVVRRVNHRRFSAELGQTLEGARFCTDAAEVERTLRSPSPSGRWLLKRPFSFSGAGRRNVRAGEIDDDLNAWLRASLREDGLQVEPWVERAGDFSLHGYLAPEGGLTLGAPVRQRVNEHGAWQATELASEGDLAPHERQALEREAERTAEALRAASYFGPFGIDAFRYRDGLQLRFDPRCEINARYSMGWAVGMVSRPDRAGA